MLALNAAARAAVPRLGAVGLHAGMALEGRVARVMLLGAMKGSCGRSFSWWIPEFDRRHYATMLRVVLSCARDLVLFTQY